VPFSKCNNLSSLSSPVSLKKKGMNVGESEKDLGGFFLYVSVNETRGRVKDTVKECTN